MPETRPRRPGRKPGTPLPLSLERRFRAYCDAMTRRVVRRELSAGLIHKALTGANLDDATHTRIAHILARWEAEQAEERSGADAQQAAVARELEALADKKVEELRETGFSLERAREIVRRALFTVVV
jgi:hypothetical protein